jgi:hypothetical protein
MTRRAGRRSHSQAPASLRALHAPTCPARLLQPPRWPPTRCCSSVLPIWPTPMIAVVTFAPVLTVLRPGMVPVRGVSLDGLDDMSRKLVWVTVVRSNQMGHSGHAQARRSGAADLTRSKGGHVHVREPAAEADVIFSGMESSSEARGKSGHSPAKTGSWPATAVDEGGWPSSSCTPI